MKKPTIGIAGSVIIDQGGMFPGYRRSYVNEDYVNSVIDNGGIPYIIPVSTDLSVIEEQVDRVDGLILSGGHDLNPYTYHEDPKRKIGDDIYPDRDFFDMELVRAAIKKNIPILAVCRGMHIINVFHGGNLYQDLSYMSGEILKHWQGATPDFASHAIKVDSASKLSEIFQVDQLHVNSFHHQTIRQLGKDFTVSATSSDGVIEAIENKSYDFMIGVQWHPEMLQRTSIPMQRLFLKLIEFSRGESL